MERIPFRFSTSVGALLFVIAEGRGWKSVETIAVVWGTPVIYRSVASIGLGNRAWGSTFRRIKKHVFKSMILWGA